MLELGEFSKKLHIEVAQILNNTNIKKFMSMEIILLIHLTKLEHKKEEKFYFQGKIS